VLDAAAQENERIRQAVMSKADQQELPLEVTTQTTKTADTDQLTVVAHLDTNTLHFHKNGDRNQSTVTFIAAVFDGSGKYLTGQQQHARVDIPDDDIPKLNATGMNVKMVFQLKPGAYTIREVVTESEDHHLAALSRNVEMQ
jgi:hypothetical protein